MWGLPQVRSDGGCTYLSERRSPSSMVPLAQLRDVAPAGLARSTGHGAIRWIMTPLRWPRWGGEGSSRGSGRASGEWVDAVLPASAAAEGVAAQGDAEAEQGRAEHGQRCRVGS